MMDMTDNNKNGSKVLTTVEKMLENCINVSSYDDGCFDSVLCYLSGSFPEKVRLYTKSLLVVRINRLPVKIKSRLLSWLIIELESNTDSWAQRNIAEIICQCGNNDNIAQVIRITENSDHLHPIVKDRIRHILKHHYKGGIFYADKNNL